MNNEELGHLAAFRLALRRFHSFSDRACEAMGLTAQHYQALLALKAGARGEPFTVKLLAQCLLIKHNSAVGLIDRMEQLGLVGRQPSETDGRSVVVAITPLGERTLRKLATTHQRELQRVAPEFGRFFRRFAKGRAGAG